MSSSYSHIAVEFHFFSCFLFYKHGNNIHDDDIAYGTWKIKYGEKMDKDISM